MTLKKDLIKQINDTVDKLIISGFTINENYTSDKGSYINWSGYKDIAFTLKKEPYDVIYKQCVIEKAYNFMLFDNAFVQLMYKVEDGKISNHRLAYYPHPNYINYQDSPDIYEELAYGNHYFTDILDKKIITVPLRFDYSNDKGKFVEKDHSYSHLTLGNYKNCRISVSKPLTPFKFILFILRSFYFDKFTQNFDKNDFRCKLIIDDTIVENEKELLHINV
ncbi:hypothetical protein C21_00384 [Arenibacter sp. NBRC 103722]|uniref:DUF2290 domain-containing protein n=1 Tax=Arenibacter sp. NBRC 103722 TaxID=1113929 RepID=UPI000852B51B|nr:DUF2290 domain-containing protein [Arenibacter sp. NBRC 103722]GBF18227.1 hypothetical protein C21_00384 [Arenibacter sp. NBRC 103722]